MPHVTLIAKFGRWIVEGIGITCLGEEIPRDAYSNEDDFSIMPDGKCFNYEYTIEKIRLWETWMNEGKLWSWPIHLTEKNWLSLNDLEDFNKALLLAQKHFKDLQPSGIHNVSDDETFSVQKTMYFNKRDPNHWLNKAIRGMETTSNPPS